MTFAGFWKIWPRKVARKAAELAFGRALKRAAEAVILAGAEAYANERHGKDQTYTAHAASWLNGDRWEDYSASNLPAQSEPETVKMWKLRLRNYTPTSYWPTTWGPRPGDANFLGPKDLEATALKARENILMFADYSRDSSRDVA